MSTESLVTDLLVTHSLNTDTLACRGCKADVNRRDNLSTTIEEHALHVYALLADCGFIAGAAPMTMTGTHTAKPRTCDYCGIPATYNVRAEIHGVITRRVCDLHSLGTVNSGSILEPIGA